MLNLLRRGTYACGTMRSDRKGFPVTLKEIMKKGLPNRGDHRAVRNGNVIVTVWQDTKAISCASTNANNTTTQITRKQKDGSSIQLQCPQAVAKYNDKMGGVDRNDQLRGYYCIQVKSHKYYKYLFYSALDIAITNTYIASKFFPEIKKKNLKDFQVALAHELVGNYSSRKKRGRPNQQQTNEILLCTFS